MNYDSFIIKDDEYLRGEFGKKHKETYAERVAAWQKVQDAKSLEEQLEDARKAAYKAVDDFIREVRNAPHTTLGREILRGRALQGLIYCRDKPGLLTDELKAKYQDLLGSLQPVKGPQKTFNDYANEGDKKLAESINKIVATHKLWRCTVNEKQRAAFAEVCVYNYQLNEHVMMRAVMKSIKDAIYDIITSIPRCDGVMDVVDIEEAIDEIIKLFEPCKQ